MAEERRGAEIKGIKRKQKELQRTHERNSKVQSFYPELFYKSKESAALGIDSLIFVCFPELLCHQRIPTSLLSVVLKY